MECPRYRNEIETYTGKPEENRFVTLTIRCCCSYWKNRKFSAELSNVSTIDTTG